jgi:hypothetical protein
MADNLALWIVHLRNAHDFSVYLPGTQSRSYHDDHRVLRYDVLRLVG